MDIKEKILQAIEESLKNLSIEMKEISLEHPDDLANGDYSTNVALAMAKKEKQNPKVLAEKILAEISKNLPAEIEKAEVAGAGFINFYLSKEFLAESVAEISASGGNFGKNSLMKGERIMVDFTDPNPFKEFHIGHLMSNAIGESLCRIFEAGGAKVFRVCYQGDIGLHVAKAIWGILQNKKDFPKDSDSAADKIAFLGKAYVLGSQKYEDEKIAGEIKEINKKIFEKSDAELNEIYEKGRKWSMEHFEEIYKKLGTKFDYYFPESAVIGDGLKIVREFLKKGIFEESQGAIIFKGENYGLHTRVFINSQGLPTYETKDIGLAKKKSETEKNLALSLVVTANEQNDYFKVVFKALEFIFPEYAKISKHIGHGMLRFAEGKMSSRKGNVITGESLLGRVEELVKEKVAAREYGAEEKKDIAEKVAVGAVKYSILRQAIGGDIIFDFDKSISFEGDSGPYLQYSYVRAKSILEKAKNEIEKLRNKETKKDEPGKLEKMLYRFPEVVERAAKEYEPHYIATYLTELASLWNAYYAQNKIIGAGESEAYRLALACAFSIVMQNGLSILGIQSPEKM